MTPQPAYNAFAPAGVAENLLVYVNLATEEDFAELRLRGQPLSERVGIARTGRIFRGDQVANAERAGLKGLILYSDPEEVTYIRFWVPFIRCACVVV